MVASSWWNDILRVIVIPSPFNSVDVPNTPVKQVK